MSWFRCGKKAAYYDNVKLAGCGRARASHCRETVGSDAILFGSATHVLHQSNVVVLLNQQFASFLFYKTEEGLCILMP